MKNLLYLFLGYTVISIKSEYTRELLNLANCYNVYVLGTDFDECYFKVKIYTKDEKKMTCALEGANIEYIIAYRKGLAELAKKYRHRIGVIFGLSILIIIMYISPLFIWEINITGIERLSKEYVTTLLYEEGVQVGAFVPFIDRKDVYMSVLNKSEDISWISVNFIGSSANVEIVERDYTVASEIRSDAANIVAAKDGQVVETDITCGRRVVKKGDIVKKGDVLVSGVYDTGKMGTRYVYSDADIYASVSDEFIVEIPLESTERVYVAEELLACTVKMFGKSINFYKNYSILEGNYDTICKEEKLKFLGLEKLPISILTTHALLYREEPVLLSEEVALERAKLKFYNILDTETDYEETLSIEDTYTVENSILIYKSVVDAIQNIALTSEFEIN